MAVRLRYRLLVSLIVQKGYESTVIPPVSRHGHNLGR